MTIMLDMINLVIPIRIIEEKYHGGWAQCLADHESGMGWSCWHDEDLFRAGGAMSSTDMQSLVHVWITKGLDAYAPIIPIDMDPNFIGPLPMQYCTAWKDMCIIEPFGATLYCPWLEIGTDTKSWLDVTARIQGNRSRTISGSHNMESVVFNFDDMIYEDSQQPTFKQSLYRFYRSAP